MSKMIRAFLERQLINADSILPHSHAVTALKQAAEAQCRRVTRAVVAARKAQAQNRLAPQTDKTFDPRNTGTMLECLADPVIMEIAVAKSEFSTGDCIRLGAKAELLAMAGDKSAQSKVSNLRECAYELFDKGSAVLDVSDVAQMLSAARVRRDHGKADDIFERSVANELDEVLDINRYALPETAIAMKLIRQRSGKLHADVARHVRATIQKFQL